MIGFVTDFQLIVEMGKDENIVEVDAMRKYICYRQA